MRKNIVSDLDIKQFEKLVNNYFSSAEPKQNSKNNFTEKDHMLDDLDFGDIYKSGDQS